MKPAAMIPAQYGFKGVKYLSMQSKFSSVVNKARVLSNHQLKLRSLGPLY